MKNADHLPLYGPGPVYVAVVVILTVAAIVLSALGIIPIVTARGATCVLRVIGIAFIAFGVGLWIAAVRGSRIDDEIVANHLVTTGVYALVRNPIYTAFTIVCIGSILVYGNVWLLVLAPVFWVFLTILMKTTEERWLRDRYGSEYVEYCGRVNRCIPWFPRR